MHSATKGRVDGHLAFHGVWCIAVFFLLQGKSLIQVFRYPLMHSNTYLNKALCDLMRNLFINGVLMPDQSWVSYTFRSRLQLPFRTISMPIYPRLFYDPG